MATPATNADALLSRRRIFPLRAPRLGGLAAETDAPCCCHCRPHLIARRGKTYSELSSGGVYADVSDVHWVARRGDCWPARAILDAIEEVREEVLLLAIRRGLVRVSLARRLGAVAIAARGCDPLHSRGPAQRSVTLACSKFGTEKSLVEGVGVLGSRRAIGVSGRWVGRRVLERRDGSSGGWSLRRRQRRNGCEAVVELFNQVLALERVADVWLGERQAGEVCGRRWRGGV
jgi:hypothetical protein